MGPCPLQYDCNVLQHIFKVGNKPHSGGSQIYPHLSHIRLLVLLLDKACMEWRLSISVPILCRCINKWGTRVLHAIARLTFSNMEPCCVIILLEAKAWASTSQEWSANNRKTEAYWSTQHCGFQLGFMLHSHPLLQDTTQKQWKAYVQILQLSMQILGERNRLCFISCLHILTQSSIQLTLLILTASGKWGTVRNGWTMFAESRLTHVNIPAIGRSSYMSVVIDTTNTVPVEKTNHANFIPIHKAQLYMALLFYVRVGKSVVAGAIKTIPCAENSHAHNTPFKESSHSNWPDLHVAD